MLQIGIREGLITDLLDTFETFANIWYLPLQNYGQAVIKETHNVSNEKNDYFTAT